MVLSGLHVHDWDRGLFEGPVWWYWEQWTGGLTDVDVERSLEQDAEGVENKHLVLRCCRE